MISWALVQFGVEVHVMPIDDLKPHAMRCWCHPCAADDDDCVIVHNAMDQREAHENGAPLH